MISRKGYGIWYWDGIGMHGMGRKRGVWVGNLGLGNCDFPLSVTNISCAVLCFATLISRIMEDFLKVVYYLLSASKGSALQGS